MSEQHEHDQSGTQDQAPASRQLTSARRRRLIKLGASSVPVALTLNSRPVMAWSCNTTSAWGSAVLRNGVASTKARATNAKVSDECWTISEWCNNSVHAGAGGGLKPWLLVYNNKFSSAGKTTDATKCTHARSNLKISHLYGSISGCTDTNQTVLAYLSAYPSNTNFVTCMLVARLNRLYANTGVDNCLSNQQGDDILTLMSSGSYTPRNGTGGAWNKDNIMTYLIKNDIVL